MKRVILALAAIGGLLVLSNRRAPALESCQPGQVAGLSSIAAELGVRPSGPSYTALISCDGNSYEIGKLISALIGEVRKAKADAAAAKSEAASVRALFTATAPVAPSIKYNGGK